MVKWASQLFVNKSASRMKSDSITTAMLFQRRVRARTGLTNAQAPVAVTTSAVTDKIDSLHFRSL
jgi:hypothetical protein